jgi:hypothetical protein
VVPREALAQATVAAGANHTCALTNGRVSCWGHNAAGQLGDGERASGATPRTVGLRGQVVEVAAGGDISCARLANHTVFCWGALASIAQPHTPTHVSGFDGAVEVDVGATIACARFADGHVACVGEGNVGTDVTGYEGCDGVWTSACQRAEDEWERNLPRCYGIETVDCAPLMPVARLRNATGLACETDCCATTEGGEAVCWGTNPRCTLDAAGGLRCPGARAPLRRSTFRGLSVPFASGVTSYGLGERLACAIVNARLHCWGEMFGILGAEVPLPSPPVEVTVGAAHACARLANQSIMCVGDNEGGQRGAPVTGRMSAARVVANVAGATAVAVGSRHACASITDGRVLCWGDNTDQQLGRFVEDASAGILAERGPLPVRLVDQARGVFVAGNHTCATRADGSLACWGGHATGYVLHPAGDLLELYPGPHRIVWWSSGEGVDANAAFGTDVGAFSFRRPEGGGRLGLVAFDPDIVAAGYVPSRPHTCRLTDGVVTCEAYRRAVPVQRMPPATELVGNGDVLCAATRDGAACTPFATPHARHPIAFTVIPGTQGIQGLSVSENRGCGILPGRGVACWTAGSASVVIPGTETATSVSVGGHSCARLGDGHVACFGSNAWGGVAPDDVTTRTPNRVIGL